MKRIVLFIVATFFMLGLAAQTPHLKFMGIPLDGTINSFQTKLTQKGFTPDATTNRQIGVGVRCFIGGTFSGEKASVFVYYNPKTKIVYRAKAVIESSTESYIDNLYNKLKKSIGDKYKSRSEFESSYHDGHASGAYYIWKDDVELLGRIDLYVTKPISYLDNRCLHIDYWDLLNSNKNDKQNSDDL